MADSDEEDQLLVDFVESSMLSVAPDLVIPSTHPQTKPFLELGFLIVFMLHFPQIFFQSCCSQENMEENRRPSKRPRLEDESSSQALRNRIPPPQPLPSAAWINCGDFSHIPPEVIHNILKFLSSEECSGKMKSQRLEAEPAGRPSGQNESRRRLEGS
ncbi:hypothetical protein KSP40_PGU020773 [Platanthera guangdongensis]|uniref:Uncharacterized protein n=1 Tax=Platanthera guangdongensis TaxID=2320717 RepID=A0ABR2MMB1_9ASPA